MITFAISTIQSRLPQARRLADSLSQFEGQVVVIVQLSDANISRVEGGVEYTFTTEKGLSKSRNLAIALAREAFVWILDDDVFIDAPSACRVREILRSTTADILIGRIGCSDTSGCYKDYSRASRIQRLQLLRCSSIEIIVRKQFLVKNNINFREDLGLGTDYPSGEENCFLLDCHSNGARVKLLEEIIIRHPCLEPGKSFQAYWLKDGVAISKGIVARSVGGPVGFMVMVRWAMRLLSRGVGLTPAALLVKGYLRG